MQLVVWFSSCPCWYCSHAACSYLDIACLVQLHLPSNQFAVGLVANAVKQAFDWQVRLFATGGINQAQALCVWGGVVQANSSIVNETCRAA